MVPRAHLYNRHGVCRCGARRVLVLHAGGRRSWVYTYPAHAIGRGCPRVLVRPELAR